jgi:hypothetical protein
MPPLVSEFDAYPLPPGAQIVARTQDVEYPLSGDWCTARVSREIVTLLPEAEVRRYYAQFHYRPLEVRMLSIPDTPGIDYLSTDAAGKHFRMTVMRIYTCLLS